MQWKTGLSAGATRLKANIRVRRYRGRNIPYGGTAE
jgi:hypothetical protein